MVSWTYFVQTKPYEEHMNPGNFALIVVDYLRFDIEKTFETMVELNALGISGLQYRLWMTGRRFHRK